MSEYKATIGLEIHAELKTKSKMFCSCKNDPDETRPNHNICPVCTAQPGTLPALNKEAIRHVLRVGTAIGAKLADFTEWDRKNYFYPDIPKGYQISQYKYPLVSGGTLAGVELTRIHLEEDTASSQHDKGDYSLVDFNRAGVPLMELVTEPVIHDVETAVRFAKELQLLLRYLGASDANMEKGEMRVEANISISKTKEFGTKVEVKNLNSFRSVGDAILYELERQEAVLGSGGKIVQETRGWDESKGETFSQRKKESSHDYRYFPEPDLPKMMISEVPEFQRLKEGLPELPWERRHRLNNQKINPEILEIFVADEIKVSEEIGIQTIGKFFDAVVALLGNNSELEKLASNYLTSDVAALSKNENKGTGALTAEAFAGLMIMIKKGEISSRGAKDILKVMYFDGGEPRTHAEALGLIQKNDPTVLKTIVAEVIKANESVVLDYKNGKETALQFLVGQGMKASKGSANPQMLAELIKEGIGKK